MLIVTPNDLFLIDRLAQVLGRAEPLDSGVSLGGRLRLSHPGTGAGRDGLSIVVVHRVTLADAVRANIAIRSESIADLEPLILAASAGYSIRPTWETVATTGAIGTEDCAIMQLLATGATNEAIADEIGVTPRSIQRMLPSVYRLLGAADRHEAVALAARFADDTQR